MTRRIDRKHRRRSTLLHPLRAILKSSSLPHAAEAPRPVIHVQCHVGKPATGPGQVDFHTRPEKERT